MNDKTSLDKFYNWAVGLYLLYVAVFANATICFPNVLLWLRIPMFAVAAGLLLVAIVLRGASRPMPWQSIAFYCLFIAALFSGVLYDAANKKYIFEIAFSGSFLKYVLFFSFAFVFEEEPDVRIKQMTWISIVSLLVYHLIVSMGHMDGKSFDYMSLGYGCAPWWLMVLQGCFYFEKSREKIPCILITAYFAVFILFYGNRGAMVLMMASLLLSLLLWLPSRSAVICLAILVPVCLILIANIEQILLITGELFGMKSEESRILEVVEQSELFYDSGRLPLWKKCLELVAQHPFLGTGVGSDRIILNGLYAHNILLELIVDFGFFLGCAIFIWLIWIGIKMLFLCKNNAWRTLFFPFYIFSMFQLLLSGTVWKSGYLLCAIIIYFSCIKNSGKICLHDRKKVI